MTTHAPTIDPAALLDPWAMPLELDLNTRHEQACGCGEQWYAHGDAHLALRVETNLNTVSVIRRRTHIGTLVHGIWHYSRVDAREARIACWMRRRKERRVKRRNA